MFISDPILKVFLEDKNYQESSIKTVDYNLRRLFWLAFGGKPGVYSTYKTQEDFYANAKLQIAYLATKQDAILKALDELPEPSQMPFLNSVIAVYSRIPRLSRKPEITAKYEKAYNQLKDKNAEEAVYKPASKKEASNVISPGEYDMVLEKFTRLATEKPLDKAIALKELILTLYKYIPPLRPQDYVNTQYLDKNPDADNFVDLAKKELVISQGKTQKNRKARVIKLPDEVITVMQRVQGLFQSDWLIPMVTKSTKPMSNSAFTHFLQGIIGQSGGPDNVGASRLRNMYVSNMEDDGATARDRKEAARVMGHSVGTQQTVYTKHSTKLHPRTESGNE